ncbi:MAG TPA: ParA family protein [Candidatus Deferrimicrobium sp.]|nr:ParA family protein [Candidatus Deferrimicrobium sp.]
MSKTNNTTQKKECEIIAVANQKGGVGKTTTAINLGASLAIAEKNVLIIDMDPQANTTTGLGIDKKVIEKDIYAVLEGKFPVNEAILDYELKFLKVLPSSRNFARFELEVATENDNHLYLKKVVEQVKDQFDYIIIDSPPSLGIITINALTAARSVLIPIQTEYYALEGLSDLIDTIERTRENFNPNLEIKGILLTMYDERTNLSKQVEEEIRKFFNANVYNSIVPRNIRLSEAPSFGKPIQLYAIKSAGSQAYMALAKEILNQ